MGRMLMGLLGLMLAAALAPGVALAAEGPPQEAPMPDSLGQILDEGGTATGSGAGGVEVTVGKTIEPTDIENYFDITLVVEASEPLEDDSTAVVIVMDASNTMNDDEAGRSPDEEGFTTSRLANAQVAASEFVRQYCEGEGLSPQRMLGVVTFNTDAQWAQGLGLQVVSAASVEELQAGIALITAPTEPDGIRFTNMEAGLLLAKNALDGLEAAHKYVVFLTDGFPTTYVDRTIEGNAASADSISGYDPYEPGAYQPDEVGSDGYFADAVLGLPCSYGTSYSDKAAARAGGVAADMKAEAGAQGPSAINIFSVGIAVGSQTVQEYADAATGTFSIVDRLTESYVIGAADDPAAYERWLAEDIAGGPSFGEGITPYADGDNLEELQGAFAGILDDIRATSGLPFEEALVSDPMGEGLEFQYFFDREGRPATGLAGQLGFAEDGAAFENTAAFDAPANAISWNLMESGYQVRVDEAGKRSYAYELAYRVRLANEAEGFAFGERMATNGTTTLAWRTAGEENEPVEFPVPAVEGYSGEFAFLKYDQDSGIALPGAWFELAHSEGCPECAAAQAASAGLASRVKIEPMRQGSDAQGIVRFENIPSGHAFTLTELEPAAGYLPLDQAFDVRVSFGSTRVADEGGSVVFESGSAEDGFGIPNKAVQVPPETPPVIPDYPPAPDVPDAPDSPDAPTKPETPVAQGPSAGGAIAQTGDAAPWRAALALAIVGFAFVALELLTRRNERKL